MTQVAPLLVRVDQVAAMLAISRRTVWSRVKAGKLPGPIKWNGLTVWKVKDLQEFAAQLGNEGDRENPEREHQQ